METTVKSPGNFESLIELVMYFKDEATCLKHLELTLHGGDIRCPHCGFDRINRFKDGKRFHCASCKSQFTAKIGTIFEHSRIPLVKWFMAMYLLGNNKKGISSIQLAKHIGVSRKTAWFMAHRIRTPLKQDKVELEGVVQSDETFVGGKNKNRHVDKKVKYENNKWRITPDKTPVLGMLDSNGKAKTVVVASTMFKDIKPVIMDSIKAGSTWVTDNYFSVRTLGKYFNREVVNHNEYQYKSQSGHTTNGIENFWSLLKRMIIGTYHNVSTKHLQKYCDEQTFRYNTRDLNQGERLTLLLSKVNCRLKYKQLVR